MLIIIINNMSLLNILPKDIENIIIDYKRYYDIAENAKQYRTRFKHIHNNIRHLFRLQQYVDPIMIDDELFLSDVTRVQIWRADKNYDFEICHNCGNYTTIKNCDEIEEIADKGLYCRTRRIWCHCYD